jgi:flagellar biosynthesis GTPase FlhF
MRNGVKIRIKGFEEEYKNIIGNNNVYNTVWESEVVIESLSITNGELIDSLMGVNSQKDNLSLKTMSKCISAGILAITTKLHKNRLNDIKKKKWGVLFKSKEQEKEQEKEEKEEEEQEEEEKEEDEEKEEKEEEEKEEENEEDEEQEEEDNEEDEEKIEKFKSETSFRNGSNVNKPVTLDNAYKVIIKMQDKTDWNENQKHVLYHGKKCEDIKGLKEIVPDYIKKCKKYGIFDKNVIRHINSRSSTIDNYIQDLKEEYECDLNHNNADAYAVGGSHLVQLFNYVEEMSKNDA